MSGDALRRRVDLSELLALVAGIVLLPALAVGWLIAHIAGAFAAGPIRCPVGCLLLGLVHWHAHLSDPRAGYPIPVAHVLPGAQIMYLAAVAAGVLTAGAGVVGWLVFRRVRSTEPGFASRRDIRIHLSETAVRARARHARPALNHRRAPVAELGLPLGRDVRTGQSLHGSLEDSFLYIGPPRAGKGINLIVPQALSAPGALLVTSTRPDTLHATAEARRRIGPVLAFDPQHVGGSVERLRWSPVAGCEDPLTAIARARALVGGARATSTDGRFWDDMTQAVVRCYLHAAAIDGRTVADVLTWSTRPSDPTPIRILRSAGLPAWAEELTVQSATHPEQRDSVWMGVRRAFDAVADPRVLESCSPPEHARFDPAQFLADRGTLYLLGSTGAQLSVAPLIAAMVEDLIETARRIAAGSLGGRLEPPLVLLLDEAANIAPIPSLPNLLADGGGSGITTVAVLQSLAQARARWRQAGADAIWDASTTKVILGGLAHAEDLSAISRLAGEIDQFTETRNRGRDVHSTSVSVRRIDALPLRRLRTLPEGHGLVLARRCPPVQAELPGHIRARRRSG